MAKQNSSKGNTHGKEDKKLMLINRTPLYEVGEFIGKRKAKKYHQAYLSNPSFELKDHDCKVYKGVLFGKGDILKLISQPQCHGVRIYFGKNTKGEPAPMLVGVNKFGKDMTKHTLILNGSFPCPKYCDDDQEIF